MCKVFQTCWQIIQSKDSKCCHRTETFCTTLILRGQRRAHRERLACPVLLVQIISQSFPMRVPGLLSYHKRNHPSRDVTCLPTTTEPGELKKH